MHDLKNISFCGISPQKEIFLFIIILETRKGIKQEVNV